MARTRLSLLASAILLGVVTIPLSHQSKGIVGPAAPEAAATADEPVGRAGRDEADSEIIPARLDIGPLRVGASADVCSILVLGGEDERGELAVKVTPPRFLKVRQVRFREQSLGMAKARRLIELGFAVDTSRPGNFSERVLVECGGRKIELAASVDILPSEARLTKVLFITQFGEASDEPGFYRPWTDLVKSAKLDVSYLDPTREGLPEDHTVPPPDGERSPVMPGWLKPYDVVLLDDAGTVFVQGPDAVTLQDYVRGGGRLVVGASNASIGSVPNANAIVKPFGLEITDEDVPFAPGQSPFASRGRPGDDDPLMKGVHSAVFRRGTPVRVANGGRGKVLLIDPNDESQGFAAVSRDGGEVVVLGPANLLAWLGEKEDGADNAVLLRNLLTKARGR